jgi:hypothetical protein
VRRRSHVRRDQRGAAVVEAALVISFVMIPILLGVLDLGERLWRAQKHPPYEPRVASSEIIGSFTCEELVDRVKTTVAENAAAASLPVGTEAVAVDVVEALPTVGAVVDVSVTLPPPEGSEDAVVTEATSKLENVSVSTESCL